MGAACSAAASGAPRPGRERGRGARRQRAAEVSGEFAGDDHFSFFAGEMAVSFPHASAIAGWLLLGKRPRSMCAVVFRDSAQECVRRRCRRCLVFGNRPMACPCGAWVLLFTGGQGRRRLGFRDCLEGGLQMRRAGQGLKDGHLFKQF